MLMNIVLNPNEPLILRDANASRVALLSLNSARIEYPVLQSVENDVEVYHVGSSEISFKILTSVGGDVAVNDNGNLLSFVMSAVTSIQGQVLFESNSLLNLIDLPALTVAVGGFLLRANPAINILNIPVLADHSSISQAPVPVSVISGATLITTPTTIAADMTLNDIDFENLVLPNATEFAGNFSVVGTDIKTLSLPAAKTIKGSVTVQGNQFLLTMNMSSVESINGSLILTNSRTEIVSLPLLISIGGNVTITNNTVLRSMVFYALSSVNGGILVADNGVMTFMVLNALTSVGGVIEVRGNIMLAQLSTPMLVSHSGILLARNFTNFMSSIVIDSNPFLINSNQSSLLLVTANIYIANNMQLLSADFMRVTHIDGSLSLINNSVLTSVVLSALTTIVGQLVYSNNPQMTGVLTPMLVSFDGLIIGQCAKCTLNTPACGGFTDAMSCSVILENRYISGSSATSLVNPVLTRAEGFLSINNNNMLTRIDFATLSYVGGNLQIYNIPTLTFASLSRLSQVLGQITICQNAPSFIIPNPASGTAAPPGLTSVLYKGNASSCYFQQGSGGCALVTCP
jgi:hypothetical protein